MPLKDELSDSQRQDVLISNAILNESIPSPGYCLLFEIHSIPIIFHVGYIRPAAGARNAVYRVRDARNTIPSFHF